MMENCQDQNNTAQTVTSTGNYHGQYPAPYICPGCGRCKDCGRPYETQPYNPWPGYPNPHVGDTPGWMQWGPTCGGGSGVTTVGGVGWQAWN